MKVIIGHDGSKHADAAVDDLRRAGLPNDVKALVVTVGEEPDVALASHEITALPGERAMSIVEHVNRQVAEALQETMDTALKASSRLRKHFPSWQVQTEALTGTPAPELIRRAKEWNADLIVVGSQGRSALGRLILGSVSMQVAAEAHCSVRIGRHNGYKTTLKLLIALDKSAESQEALRLTLQRVWPPGTELRVVGAEEEVGPIRSMFLSSNGGPQLRSGVWSSKEFHLLTAGAVKISAGALKGPIEDVLMEQAHEWQADCVVIGSASEDQVRELAANTECSLEIIRLSIGF